MAPTPVRSEDDLSPLYGKECVLVGKAVGSKAVDGLMLDCGAEVDLSKSIPYDVTDKRVMVRGTLRLQSATYRRDDNPFELQMRSPPPIPDSASSITVTRPAISDPHLVAVWDGSVWVSRNDR